MKRKFTAFLLAISMLAALTGCTPESPPLSVPERPSSDVSSQESISESSGDTTASSDTSKPSSADAETSAAASTDEPSSSENSSSEAADSAVSSESTTTTSVSTAAVTTTAATAAVTTTAATAAATTTTKATAATTTTKKPAAVTTTTKKISAATTTKKPSDESKPSDNGVLEMKTFLPTSDNVKYLGRAMLTDNNTLWLAFSGSGAEFTMHGTSAKITVEGDSVAKSGSADNKPRIAIYVNGVRKIDDMLDKEEKTYEVKIADTATDAVVTVVKLSETAMSTCAIKSVEAVSTNGISPTAKKDLFIEFVGDSITCGYGVDDENRDHHFKTSTEDVTKAYAYKTAAALNADYSMVSISGYGIISGYTTADKISAQTIPQYYDKVGFSYGNYRSMQPQKVDWDFSYTPDVVVINLGTNDDSYTGSNTERQQEYKKEYIEFLKKIRAKNPKAVIVCALGIMGAAPLCKVIKNEVIPEYTAATGDSNIYFVKFAQQSASDGYAADWHPTEKTHTKAADKLVKELKEILSL